MKTTFKDPLLTAAKVLTIIVRIVLVIGMIGLAIGMAVVAIGSAGWLPDGQQITFSENIGREASWVVALAMATGLVALGLMFGFVQDLAQIIATVGDGDPFILGNADRLTHMAWLSVAVQGLGIVASLLGNWAEKRYAANNFEFNSEFTFTGIALALVLFILARVFREGARMREELEGTV
jgi:hypothetical protein